MIIDNLTNIKLYNLPGNFKSAIDFIEKTDLNALPFGKSDIDGENCYVNVFEYQTNENVGQFEAHNEYADIQIIIDGNERIDWCERTDCINVTKYDEDLDYILLDSDTYIMLKIKQGQFSIFFPNDAHRPGIVDGNIKMVKKAVVKVKL